MSEVLVLVDHVDGKVTKPTLELLAIARRLGEPSAVFIGEAGDAAETLGKFGAEKVYTVADSDIKDYLVAPKAEVLAQLVEKTSPAAVLVPSTGEGKEIAARLAVKTESGLITDAVDVAADGTTTQSVFAGNYTVTAKVTKGTPIITVKPNSAAPEEVGAAGTQGGMQPQMLESIDKAKQDPSDFEAQLKAAEAYYQIERFDEAIMYLTNANKLKPDDRDVIVHLGNANFDADKYDEAQKWYLAALEKKPDDVNVRTDLGLTYVFKEPADYDKAITEFNKALETDPNHIQTLQNLTVAYTKKGDAAKAKETLAKLETADPQNVALARLKTDIETLSVPK